MQITKECDVKICLSYDEAEGQRLNLSSVTKMTDMSKLSLGRMKSVQSTLESSEDRRDACCS